MFPTIKSSNAADEKGMLYYQKGRWEMLSTVLWLTRTSIRWYVSLLLVKKQPDSLPSHRVTLQHQLLQHLHLFPWVPVCTLKITFSIIIMVLKYKTKLRGQIIQRIFLDVYISVYISERDPSLDFLTYNPGGWRDWLIFLKTYTHISLHT